MQAEVPGMNKPPLLTMADMGMAHGDMDHGSLAGMDHANLAGMDHSKMKGMDHSAMAGMGSMQGMDQPKLGNMAGLVHSKLAFGDNTEHCSAPGRGLTRRRVVGGQSGTVRVNTWGR